MGAIGAAAHSPEAVIWLICCDSSQIIESERCCRRWRADRGRFARHSQQIGHPGSHFCHWYLPLLYCSSSLSSLEMCRVTSFAIEVRKKYPQSKYTEEQWGLHACMQTQTLPWDSPFTLCCLIWSWDVSTFLPPRVSLVADTLVICSEIIPHVHHNCTKITKQITYMCVYSHLIEASGAACVWPLTGVLFLWRRGSASAKPQDSMPPDPEIERKKGKMEWRRGSLYGGVEEHNNIVNQMWLHSKLWHLPSLVFSGGGSLQTHGINQQDSW